MVTVSVSETYDLSTVKDKMTLIGVHTPTKELIQKTYPGLCMNSKYCRIVKTDVVLSAVSGTVAITPDMVGDNSQDGIAPEDVLNPILYKAVSNDSWSTLEARLNGLLEQSILTGNTFAHPVLQGPSAFAENDGVTGLSDEFGVYYSLLSNRDGFKMAPIQHGLEMRGLVPMVFEKYYNSGENYLNNVSDSAPNIMERPDGSVVKDLSAGRYMRGRPHPMPRFNTTFLTGVSGATGTNSNGMGLSGTTNGTPRNAQCEMPSIVPVMLCAIIMPPCRKTKLFFRMRVRTFIEFTEIRPIQEISAFDSLSSDYSPVVYHSDYNQQSSKMENITDMVDTKNADIQKIMEGR